MRPISANATRTAADLADTSHGPDVPTLAAGSDHDRGTAGRCHSWQDDEQLLTHVVGPSLYVGLATCLVMFLILVPYCAFKSLGKVLGDQYLVRLFFVERLDKRRDGGND